MKWAGMFLPSVDSRLVPVPPFPTGAGQLPGGRGAELRDRPFPLAPRPLYIGLWTV